MVSLLLCMFFCGCSKKNLDNNKTADNVTSSTDSVIENTDITSIDSSDNSEITTTEVSTTNYPTTETATESSSAIKDDNTTNNEGNNGNVTTQPSGGNSGNGGTTPATIENPTTEDKKPEPPTTTESPSTEDTKPEPPATTEKPSTTEDIKPEPPATTEKPSTTTESTTTECQHKWTLVDEIVYIEPVYQTQTVCVQEAYDENVYEYHSFCNGCGYDLTVGVETGEIDTYGTHVIYCQGGSTYHADRILVDTIHHDPVYETKEIIVSGGYDERVVHTVCSICGYQIN